MIALALLVFATHAAEYPIIRLQGKLVYFDNNVICLAGDKTETCFKRTKDVEYIIKQGTPEIRDVLVDNRDILKGRKND